jgi:hypothetical protein
MQPKDVENLKVGDRVRHTDGTPGTITDVGCEKKRRQGLDVGPAPGALFSGNLPILTVRGAHITPETSCVNRVIPW